MAQTDWENGARESRPGGGNGTTGDERHFRAHASEAKANAEAFAQSLGSTARHLDGVVRNLAATNPYAVLAGALGAGLVLGGGIPPAMIRTLAGFAGRYALAAIMSSVVAAETVKNEGRET